MTDINKDSKLAVSYARVSTKDQERTGHTLPVQARMIQEYSITMGLTIVKEFIVAESAAKKDRRYYREMWEFLAKHPEIKHVIFEEIDRFTRNDDDKTHLEHKVNDEGYIAHFVMERLTFDKETSPDQIMFFDFMVAKAKNYSTSLSRRVKMGQQGKLEDGGYPGGKSGYGYKKISGRLVPKEDEAPIVKLMFEWCDRLHLTLKQIAADLNDQGFRNRAGKHFSSTFVHRILTDATYYGMMKWGEQLHPGKHEPLVDKVCFDRVGAWLSRKHPSHQIIHDFTYRGFIKCGECGCAVTADTHKNHVYYHSTYYRPCNQRYSVREEWVEGHVVTVLDGLHLGPKTAAIVENRILAKRDETNIVKKFRLEDLKQQTDQIIGWIDQAYTDKVRGIIDEAMFIRKSQEFQNRKDEIAQLLAGTDKLDPQNCDVPISVLNLADRASGIYEHRKPPEKRKLLNFLLSYAVLKDKKLDLTLRLPFQQIALYRENEDWSGWRELDSLSCGPEPHVLPIHHTP